MGKMDDFKVDCTHRLHQGYVREVYYLRGICPRGKGKSVPGVHVQTPWGVPRGHNSGEGEGVVIIILACGALAGSTFSTLLFRFKPTFPLPQGRIQGGGARGQTPNFIKRGKNVMCVCAYGPHFSS